MDQSREERKYNITKLSETNYHLWKHKIQLIMMKDETWQVIGSPIPAAPDPEWIKKDNLAKATIGLAIEDKFLVDIRNEVTALGMWNKLASIQKHDNLGSCLVLYRRMFTARYHIGSNMTDHIASMLDTASQLEDLGYPVLQELLCSAILGSLPKEFNAMITAKEGRNADSITILYIREKIMEEEAKHHQESSGNTRAFNTGRYREYNNRRDIQCHYCHKTGHIRKDCRTLKQHETHHSMKNQRSTYKGNYQNKNNKQYSKYTPVKDTVVFEDHKKDDEKVHITQKIQTRALTARINTEQDIGNQWVIDNGAGTHMCNNAEEMKNIQLLKRSTIITTASGEQHRVLKSGTCNLKIKDQEGNVNILTLDDVLLVEELTDSLISVSQLTEDDYEVYFKNKICWITKDDKTYKLGEMQNGLYIWQPIETVITADVCRHVWHQRFGHRNIDTWDKQNNVEQTPEIIISECTQQHICDICELTKMSNNKFELVKDRKASQPFHTLHADLTGPITPNSLGNNKYALSIIDDYSRFSTIYLIKDKHQAADAIKEYIEEGINKFNRRPIISRSDGGGEFDNCYLNHYLKSKGTKHFFSIPYTPQENGLIERHNRTLMEGTRALIKQAKLPKNLWGEMASTTTYLNNLIPKKDQEKSPYEVLHSVKPEHKHLRTIGSKVYYLNNKPHKLKLEDRGIMGVLVGYGTSNKFYRVYNTEDQKIYISRCVSFEEETCPFNDKEVTITLEPTNVKNIVPVESEDKPDNVTTSRRSNRSNKGVPAQVLTYNQHHGKDNTQQDWYGNLSLRPDQENMDADIRGNDTNSEH